MRALMITLLMLTGPAAFAEEWQFQVVPYLWMPNYEATSDGDPSTPPSRRNLDFDTETSLEAAFLVYTSARKGRHYFAFEFDWLDVSTDARSRFDRLPRVDVDWELFVYTLGYGYRVYEGDRDGDGIDLGLGARIWDLSIDTEFGGAGLDGVEASDSASWTDAYAEVRAVHTIGESGAWYLSGFAIVGAGGSDRMIDVAAGLGYRWSQAISTSVGYRSLVVDYKDLEFTQKGVLVSLGWRF